MAATGEQVKLIGSWASPYVMRVRIALNLKGVEYEFLHEDLRRKSELLLSSNPVYKKIPVLIHNGRPINESMIILEYIDEAWKTIGPSILPTDPYRRSVARFWASCIDDKLTSAIRVLRGVGEEEEKERAIEQASILFQQLELAFGECSKGKEFFGGERIGYLDIALGSRLGWIRAAEKIAECELLNEAKTPGLVGWAERFCSNEAVMELMPDTDKLVEYNSRLIQAMYDKAAPAP